MKKILLFCCFFSMSLSFSQIINQVSNYKVCDLNGDGYEAFNLSTKIPEILGNLNPSTHIVSFHISLIDAVNGTNQIINESSWINTTPYTQQIYVSVTNTVTSNIEIASFFVLAGSYAGVDGTTTICDLNTTAINLFDLINGEQPGGTWTRVSGTGGTFNSTNGIFTPSTGTTSSTFIYTITGIAPCNNDTSTVTLIIVPNCNTQPVCGGLFLDNGGSNSNYSNNLDTTTTICPTIPGQMVTVTFSAFNIENFNDALYVFNGTSIASFQIASANTAGNVPGGLAGGFWGTTIPGPFTSSSPSGCLTFRFRSDSANNLAGWIANVSCDLPDGCSPPTTINTTNITNSSIVLSWPNQSNTTSWEILVLPFGSPAPTPNASSGIFTTSNPFTITGLIPDACYSAYVRSICTMFGTNFLSEWSQPTSFCMYNCENNGQCTESLSLVAFIDLNTNGTKDSNEPIFNNGTFVYQVNSGSPIYASSNTNAYTILESNPANSYNLNFQINANLINYYSASTTYNNIFVPTGSGNTTYYFPVTQLQPYNDLEVQIIPNANPQPGFLYTNTLIYKNKGTLNIPSGTVTFTKDPLVSIGSVSQTGITSVPSGFTYNFTNLAPNESRLITVTMQAPTIPTINLGTTLTSSASILPLVGDAIPANNSATLSQVVIGSYDPNDKMEADGGKIVISNFSSNDYLIYTIRFENTGTANASFIRIEDELNSLLNAATVEVLNASHSYNFKRVNNKLIWNFYSINLPPTVTNPVLSQGFVQFKVKPNASYSVGTIIPNAANIYFDYNPPIFTGIFNTEFVNSLKNSDFDSGDFIIYPNPTNGLVQISLKNNSETITTIMVYDILGKVVKKVASVNSNQINFDVSELSSGIYMVEVTTSNDLTQLKKLILK